MALPPHKLIHITILTFILNQFVFADWQSLFNQHFVIPPHTYRIKLDFNQTIKGTLTCLDTGDLDIYIYKQSTNVLNNEEALFKFASNSLANQLFNFTSPQSNTYFIRVYPYKLAPNQTLNYILNMVVDEISTFYSGFFYEKYKDNLVLFFNRSLTFSNIALKLEASSQINGATVLFGQYSQALSNNQVIKICQNRTVNINSFILIIHNNIGRAHSLSSVTLRIQYFLDYYPCSSECPERLYWEELTQKCCKIPVEEHQKNISNSAVIAVSVLIPLALIGIMATVLIYLFKKYSKNKVFLEIKVRKHTNDEINLTETQEEIKSASNKCSICLGLDCDTILQCNHNFHKKCIRSYMKKRKMCPLCKQAQT